MFAPTAPTVPSRTDNTLRPPSPSASPTLADVFRRYGDAYLATHSTTAQQRDVLEAIRQCRTFARGYHLDYCPDCGHTAIRPNSCGNRHCPTCQAKDRVEWVEARMQELLPVSEAEKNKWYTLRSSIRANDVIPLSMECRSFKIDGRKIFIGHMMPCVICPFIKLRQDGQPRGRGGLADAIHDHFSADERLPSPIRRNLGDQAVFDAIPLAGSGGIVADIQRQSRFVRETVEFIFPQADPRTIASPAIRCD